MDQLNFFSNSSPAGKIVARSYSQVIQDSGITICYLDLLSGSEDDEVHCFKPHGPISEGRAVLMMDARYSVEK
uniref:Uncharacterized protein n=1 Tax=Ditylenchus dipsaci TaxID=166011 RepID=A0A915EKC7_9BILA